MDKCVDGQPAAGFSTAWAFEAFVLSTCGLNAGVRWRFRGPFLRGFPAASAAPMIRPDSPRILSTPDQVGLIVAKDCFFLPPCRPSLRAKAKDVTMTDDQPSRPAHVPLAGVIGMPITGCRQRIHCVGGNDMMAPGWPI